MEKKTKIIFLIIVFVFCFLFYSLYIKSSVFNAQAISNISDKISLSWPGTGANHSIKFLTTSSTPPLGKLVITPQAGMFTIPNGFDYTDIDLATSSSSSGPFFDRTLAATSSAFADGVVAVASTTNGSITFTLNSSFGIDGGVYVQVELGTNATYGVPGDLQIINNSNTGSYIVNAAQYTASDQLIERANTMIAIVEPVKMSTESYKTLSLGAPIGYLTYGTTNTVMSLVTNFMARCRYSTASGTLYADMTNEFPYASSTSYYPYHSVGISGLVNGGSYEYYIRCIDMNGVSDDATLCRYLPETSPYTDINGDPITALYCTDYWIPFSVSLQEGDEGDEGGDPGGSGGGSGGGGGGGGGGTIGPGSGELLPFPPLPGAPSVVFEGWAYPSSYITAVKDSVEETTVAANANASFSINIYQLTQGVYTFGLWAEDKDKRKSITESFTFWVKDGTKTEIYEIIIPPTIEINKNSVEIGEIIEVFGYSTPNSNIETWMYPSNTDDSLAIKKQGVVSNTGLWSMFLNTTDLEKGTYKIKAKTNIIAVGESDFSYALDCGVGVEVSESLCQGADLNHDGRVNITDFSILLYYWGTDNECADQNKDGTVNLVDFSILMYYWTG